MNGLMSSIPDRGANADVQALRIRATLDVSDRRPLGDQIG
jgi:hypothetical protein